MTQLSVSKCLWLALLAGAALPLPAGASLAGHDGYTKRYEYGHPAPVYGPPPGGNAYAHPVARGEIPALLAQQGFVRVYDIDKDDGVYEVEARHANGRKAEIEIDIATGRILDIDWD